MSDSRGLIAFIKLGFWFPENARFRQLFGDYVKQTLIHACTHSLWDYPRSRGGTAYA